MTTYILHWGWSWILSNLISEIGNIYNIQKKRILFLYHARKINDWKNSFTEDIRWLETIGIMKQNCLQGSPDLNTLIKQIKDTDIVIIKGWSSALLCKRLFPLKPYLWSLFYNKLVIGISAWAYLLSKCFFSNDRNWVYNWFWLVDINIVCHYKDSMNIYLEPFKKNHISTYKLKEKEYITIISDDQ